LNNIKQISIKKFSLDETIIGLNETSIESSLNTTHIRDLSYSPNNAAIPQKKRIEQVPWTFRKIDIQNQNNQKQNKYEQYKKQLKDNNPLSPKKKGFNKTNIFKKDNNCQDKNSIKNKKREISSTMK
jgi:hypothetical protein